MLAAAKSRHDLYKRVTANLLANSVPPEIFGTDTVLDCLDEYKDILEVNVGGIITKIYRATATIGAERTADLIARSRAIQEKLDGISDQHSPQMANILTLQAELDTIVSELALLETTALGEDKSSIITKINATFAAATFENLSDSSAEYGYYVQMLKQDPKRICSIGVCEIEKVTSEKAGGFWLSKIILNGSDEQLRALMPNKWSNGKYAEAAKYLCSEIQELARKKSDRTLPSNERSALELEIKNLKAKLSDHKSTPILCAMLRAYRVAIDDNQGRVSDGANLIMEMITSMLDECPEIGDAALFRKNNIETCAAVEFFARNSATSKVDDVLMRSLSYKFIAHMAPCLLSNHWEHVENRTLQQIHTDQAFTEYFKSLPTLSFESFPPNAGITGKIERLSLLLEHGSSDQVDKLNESGEAVNVLMNSNEGNALLKKKLESLTNLVRSSQLIAKLIEIGSRSITHADFITFSFDQYVGPGNGSPLSIALRNPPIDFIVQIATKAKEDRDAAASLEANSPGFEKAKAACDISRKNFILLLNHVMASGNFKTIQMALSNHDIFDKLQGIDEMCSEFPALHDSLIGNDAIRDLSASDIKRLIELKRFQIIPGNAVRDSSGKVDKEKFALFVKNYNPQQIEEIGRCITWDEFLDSTIDITDFTLASSENGKIESEVAAMIAINLVAQLDAAGRQNEANEVIKSISVDSLGKIGETFKLATLNANTDDRKRKELVDRFRRIFGTLSLDRYCQIIGEDSGDLHGIANAVTNVGESLVFALLLFLEVYMQVDAALRNIREIVIRKATAMTICAHLATACTTVKVMEHASIPLAAGCKGGDLPFLRRCNDLIVA
jgi:hypothetical protein